MNVGQLTAVIVALVSAIALALLNPTTDAYMRFVQGELDKALERMSPTAPTKEQEFIRQVFRAQSPKIVDGIVRPHTRRRNWGFVSFYRTQVMDTDVLVVGVAGTFIPIRGVEEAAVRIGRLAFD